MRLGILGGTFDPVHYGHLLVAETCREQLSLDQIWFVPANVPPHKQHEQLTTPKQRIEMLELAIGGNSAFAVCDQEIARGGVSYTVDTLAQLKREDPERELFFLMGADSLHDLPTWREPARVCSLALPVVVCRAGKSGDTAAGKAPDYSGLAALVSADRLEQIRQHQVSMPRIDLSSTEIRRRVREGQSIRYRTPRAVEEYIRAAGLYSTLQLSGGPAQAE